MRGDRSLQKPLRHALEYAALSGPFDPIAAIPRDEVSEPDDLAVLATMLASECDTSPTGSSGRRWLMRRPHRVFTLRKLAEEDRLASAVADRRAQSTDEETTDLLSVLLDQSPFNREGIELAIARKDSRERLRRIVVALDRAGEAAPFHGLLDAARSALAQMDRTERGRRVAARGFYGRVQDEMLIAAWVDGPISKPPVTCLYVSGPPGIGKSALLEAAVRSFNDRHPEPFVVRLDFDRAGLDVIDRWGLTLEAARQIAERLGSAGTSLLRARLDATGDQVFSPDETSARRSGAPLDVIHEMGRSTDGRPVLFVLDTMEVLRSRGETHSGVLFDWFDQLMKEGIGSIRVIAAGRGQALANRMDRVALTIELEGLAETDAVSLLTHLNVQGPAQASILGIAQGVPLRLRLAAEIANRHGAAALPKGKAGKEVDAAYLYRFLLSRIDDPQLRALADPGLVVRRINAAVISEVLAPNLRLGRLTEAQAQRLLEELAGQHWLVEADPGSPGFLKHRTDMRSMLLPLLYSARPRKCAEIDEAALRWFAADPAPWRQLESAYHRLQLMRTRPSDTPTLSPEIVRQFDDDTIAELPPVAQNVVRRLRGERSTSFRSSGTIASSSSDDDSLAREILGVIVRRDWAEGRYLADSANADRHLDPRSAAAEAVRALLWRCGRWTEARNWLRERDRIIEDDGDLADMPPEFALARLEMRAEFEPQLIRSRRKLIVDLVPSLQRVAGSTGDNAARHGALAALLPSAEWGSRASSRGMAHPLEAAKEYWSRGGGPLSEAAFETSHARLRPFVAAMQIPEARLFAGLTPYVQFASNLVAAAPNRHLLDDAAFAERSLIAAGALVEGSTNAGGKVREPVTDLAAMGLFAEWAGACAFQRGNADLALIARSAERWRRTVAGLWSYGTIPAGWTRRSLDETLTERISALHNQPSPQEAALEQLGVWTLPERGLMPSSVQQDSVSDLDRRARNRAAGALTLERIRHRIRRIAIQGGKQEEKRLAAALLSRRVPAAFVPAAAVLFEADFD